MKGLLAGTVVSRHRDDLRPGLQMATSGRHRVFFEIDQSRVLVVRVLHDRMDYELSFLAEAIHRSAQRASARRRTSPLAATL
jgi:hypothetical protein